MSFLNKLADLRKNKLQTGGPPFVPPQDPPVPEPPIMCFVAGTKIDMADGTKKAIENIAVGDEVIALGNNIDKVSYVHDIPEDNRHLWTINDRITATDAHAFLTKEGWKSNNSELSNQVYTDYGIKVKDLQIGDELITNDGVEKVTKLENEKDFIKVYNFTTSNTHTYLVDGVVSHNKMPYPRPPITPPPPPPPPPDNRILQGIGGYLSPSEIEMFTNPPVPNNQAGLIDMARLLQQQQDTFGSMLTYGPPAAPPDDDPPPDDPPDDDPPPDDPPDDVPPDVPPPDDPPPDDPPEKPPYVPPYVPPFVPPFVPPQRPPPPFVPPNDRPPFVPPIEPPFVPPQRPPFVPPNDLPPMVPPIDIPIDRDVLDYGYGPGIMPPLPPFDISGIGNLPVATPIDLPRVNDGIGSISINDLPRYNERVTLPVPRMPSGMETLVSPEVFMGRGRGRLR